MITHTNFVEHGIIAHIPWCLSHWKLLNCIIQRSSCFYNIRACQLVSLGTFRSTKNSEIFVKLTNGTEMNSESFQKIQTFSNFWKAIRSTKFRTLGEKSQMERKFPVRSFRRFLYTSLGCPLFLNSRMCFSLCHCKLPEIQTGRFHRMKAPICLVSDLGNGGFSPTEQRLLSRPTIRLYEGTWARFCASV